MQYSASSNSPSDHARRLSLEVAVWSVRVLLGVLFILSGWAKADDVWGSVYKIGEYLAVWQVHVPRSLIVVGVIALSELEFLAGAFILIGVYRRVSVGIILALMCGFLPVTAYIAIANPVSDCGCFGDLWIISNTATFVKNIVITAVAVWLCKYNAKVPGLISNNSQWAVGIVLVLYVLAVSLIGYNIQPIADFRRFHTGVDLLDDSDADIGQAQYQFLYRNADGDTQLFTIDNLPDDDDDQGWEFVERRLVGGSEDAADGFAIIADGVDVTADIISRSGEQLIVTIPEVLRAELSGGYIINDLAQLIESRGGSLIALIAGGDKAKDYWTDIAMASYPVYTAEPNLIKELARGNTGLVYLRDGIVQWKRTVSSINYASMTSTPADQLLASLNPKSSVTGVILSSVTFALLLLIFAIDRGIILIHRRKNNKQKS